MYVRNGPNMRCRPPTNKHHAFNGEAMLHMVTLSSEQSVKYTNSWVEQKNQDAGGGGECGPNFSFGDINGGGLAFLRLLVLRLKLKLLGIQRPPQVDIEVIKVKTAQNKNFRKEGKLVLLQLFIMQTNF